MFGSPEMIIWAMWPVVVRPAKSERGTSMATQFPVARPGVVVASNVNSCSTSSPPSKAPSAPKSTSLILNTAGAAVGSGVQMSMWKSVIAVASIGAVVASAIENTRFVYSFVSSPWICTSSTSAWSKSTDHVSTSTSVYALLNIEITSASGTVGSGAAAGGSVGSPPPSSA